MKLGERVRFQGNFHLRVIAPDGSLKDERHIKNLVPAAIMTAILENMFDATPSTSILTGYIAVGSSATAPADGNTHLGTEVARKAVTSRAYSGKKGTCSAVFAAGEATGTHVEFGVFAGGSASANTGTLCSRTTGSIVVGALDSLFIDWELTLADA